MNEKQRAQLHGIVDKMCDAAEIHGIRIKSIGTLGFEIATYMPNLTTEQCEEIRDYIEAFDGIKECDENGVPVED